MKMTKSKASFKETYKKTNKNPAEVFALKLTWLKFEFNFL